MLSRQKGLGIFVNELEINELIHSFTKALGIYKVPGIRLGK